MWKASGFHLFYLRKACDTAWKHGVLLGLYKTGIRGRCFRVRVGNMYSDPHRRQVSHRVVFFPSRWLVSRIMVLCLVYCLILNVPFV